MRKSREILEYRWTEMTVIASDTYDADLEADVNSASDDAESAESKEESTGKHRSV